MVTSKSLNKPANFSINYNSYLWRKKFKISKKKLMKSIGLSDLLYFRMLFYCMLKSFLFLSKNILTMKKIKPVFKNFTKDQKEIFKNSRCLLLISVGQEAHEADKFEATIKLINESFKSCIISLYDSLQRHTMALNSLNDPQDFHELANRRGDDWLRRNEKFYGNLTMPYKITRWDEWLNHSKFSSQRNKITASIETDTLYKEAFEEAMNKYLDRYCKRLDESIGFNIKRARELCFDYLLEECTVLCLWTELRCEYEIYPNWHNVAIEATRKRFILPFYENLLHSVRIGFRNAKQAKPQQFEGFQNEEKTEF